jgi:hypothetical protein
MPWPFSLPIAWRLSPKSWWNPTWLKKSVAKPRLHLDADVSLRSLQKELLTRGHDVTRTLCEWMPLDATDEQQLLQASARGRCILTFNIRDFMRLSQTYPAHGGIILAQQRDWALASLIIALDALLTQTEAADWPGHVRWLNEWRS